MNLRPTQRVWFVATLAAALFLSAGCASQTDVKALTHADFVLVEGKNRTEVSTKLAEEIKLQLPPIKADGYRWEIFAHDSRYLRQTSEITPPQGPQRISSVSFLAVHTTSRATVIKFLLVPVGQRKESKPVDSHDVAVTIETS